MAATTRQYCHVPTAVSGLANVQTMGNGDYQSCAATDTSMRCWGYNASGQIGDGTTTQRHVPTAVTLTCP